MTVHITTHVAEVAVPGQLQITVRASHGELELGQEYDGEWHGIYVQPDNVLTLIRSMLRMIGREDVHLYEQKPGGLCTDVDWPDGAIRQEREAEPKPKDHTAAKRQRRRRAKLKEQRDDARKIIVTDRDEAESALPLQLVAAE